MEFLNKVQLRGIVGQCTLTPVHDRTYARMSVMTQAVSQGSDGAALVSVTWHNVSAFNGPDISLSDLQSITKGTKVELEGLIVQQRYTRADGAECSTTVISAKKLSVIRGD